MYLFYTLSRINYLVRNKRLTDKLFGLEKVNVYLGVLDEKPKLTFSCMWLMEVALPIEAIYYFRTYEFDK